MYDRSICHWPPPLHPLELARGGAQVFLGLQSVLNLTMHVEHSKKEANSAAQNVLLWLPKHRMPHKPLGARHQDDNKLLTRQLMRT